MAKSTVPDPVPPYTNADGHIAVVSARWLVAAAAAGVVAAAPRAVLAQQAQSVPQSTVAQQQQPADPSTTEQQGSLQTVEVTGTLLKLPPGMSTPTPVISVPTNELLSIAPQTVIEALAQLPSLADSTTVASIDGRTTVGQGSFLNLRNLGPQETLVLLDGMRLVPNNIQNYVDVSMIPQALLSRVDIVTGGASAAYGSDAVAGVVNFVLNTNYTGFKFDAGTGRSNFGDGATDKVSLAWGKAFLDSRLHVIASFDWDRQDAAQSSSRPWADGHCAVITTPGVTQATASPSNPLDEFACNVTTPYSSYGGAITSGPLTSATQGISFGPGGVPEPFIYGADHTASYQVGGTGNPTVLSQPFNFITPVDDKMGFGRLQYDISDNVQAFAQLTVTRSIADYPENVSNFYQTRPFTIYSGNPFIPASIQSEMTQDNIPSFQLGIAPEDWGYIQTDDAEEAYDAMAGLKGAFGSGWTWMFHFEHGRTQWKMTQPGNPDLQNLYAAVNAVKGPNGTTTCEAALLDPAQYGNCVPLDILGTGVASPQALAYIFDEGNVETDYNVMTQNDASATINGTPFSSWAGPVSVALGAEWRSLLGVESGDPISNEYPLNFSDIAGVPQSIELQDGGWLTTNPHSYGGEYHVSEGFLELEMPLARNLPAMQALDLNASGRLIDYSQSGMTEAWKGGLTWRPVHDLLYRVTESRDIRAPNIYDLYAGYSSGSEEVIDPQLQDSEYEIKFSSLGNQNLQPERATTFTTGLTYTPAWLSGFAASVDYYSIKIAGLIADYTPQQELDFCASGISSFCGDVDRLSNGQIYLIDEPLLNLNDERTSGYDFQLSYDTGIAGGTFNAQLIGTKLITESTTDVTPQGSIYTNYVNDIAAGDPSWIVNLITSYTRGSIGFNLSGRFIGSGEFNTVNYTPSELSAANQSMPSNFTLNGGISYTFRSEPGHPQLYFTIENLLNKAPPILPTTAIFGVETNAELYDTMGRYFFGGFRIAF